MTPLFKTIMPYGVAIAGEPNGTLYGCTDCAFGGQIVSLTPPATTGGSWTETTLYQFQFTPNGEQTAYVSSLIMTKGPGGLPVFFGLATAAEA